MKDLYSGSGSRILTTLRHWNFCNPLARSMLCRIAGMKGTLGTFKFTNIAYCLEHGIAYESFWTLTGSPSLFRHSLITNIADSKKATNAQIVYKFAQSLGIIPLAGSTNEQHMKDGLESENLDIGEHLDELKGLIGH
ncbi:unnamed protein product [Rhizoctonia solani]|uniref:NADP-dependent oxidoreductase domain-containing protein n=1 Tax=Rhizoctonia solani TaxID=456999 RepID=A0A8H3E401_9AGAM|nr:unnamed protein product [Rhizoctonia solani]